jgi:outer membrane protein W
MKKYILTLAIVLGGLSLSAQNFNRYFSFYYEPSAPMGDAIAEDFSWWGGGFRYQYPINDQLYMGMELGWNSFSEYKQRTTYQVENGAITTDLYTYSHNIPLAVRTDYFVPMDGSIIPYIGLSVGTMYSDQSIYFSNYVIEDEAWGFMVRPQIGALIALDVARRQFIDIGLRYSWSNPDFRFFEEVEAIEYLGIHIGFTIPTY